MDSNFTAPLGPAASARLSTVFDYGGIIGAIAAGVISDYTNKPATTCAALLVLAIPTVSWALVMFRHVSYCNFVLAASHLRGLGHHQHCYQLLYAVCRWSDGQWAICIDHNVRQCGIRWVTEKLFKREDLLLTRSPITGQHPSLEGNSKAVATVTAIIDGTGSFGAAVGPLLAGVLSTHYSWNSVIYMVAISEAFAILLLVRLIMREFEPLRRNVRIEWEVTEVFERHTVNIIWRNQIKEKMIFYGLHAGVTKDPAKKIMEFI